MSTATGLMTVEEFRQLNLPENGSMYELHNGQLVEMSRPKHRHIVIQLRIVEILNRFAASLGQVVMEFPFRAVADYDLRVADVAYITFKRFSEIDPEDNLCGAPDLVVEVASSSNTAEELDEKESLCLANGCLEFWVVYPKRRIVKVTTQKSVERYTEADVIPVRVFSAQIRVSDIFAGVP